MVGNHSRGSTRKLSVFGKVNDQWHDRMRSRLFAGPVCFTLVLRLAAPRPYMDSRSRRRPRSAGADRPPAFGLFPCWIARLSHGESV